MRSELPPVAMGRGTLVEGGSWAQFQTESGIGARAPELAPGHMQARLRWEQFLDQKARRGPSESRSINSIPKRPKPKNA